MSQTIGILALLLVYSLGRCSESLQISSATELIELFNKTTGPSFGDDIELIGDLDFSGSGLTLPLGENSDNICTAYSGVLKGNNHSIKGLKMNTPFQHAGLFCQLENATIQDLFIDSSCNFSGVNVGGLCVTAKGSLIFTNVVNMATISGSDIASGLVGVLEQTGSTQFNDCHNVGNVVGSASVGGLVGCVSHIINARFMLSNCTNNGTISGNNYVGGLIGFITRSQNSTLTISDCANNGTVNGTKWYTGGFIGYMALNKNLTVAIMNSVNIGDIIGDSGAGGFVGNMECYDNDQSILFITDNAVNKGSVSANTNSACGLFCVHQEEYRNIQTIVMNSINEGSVTSKDMTCGLFCVGFTIKSYVNTTVMNSINKGSVSGSEYGYGITNIITKARNIVSIGEVTSLSNSYSFWGESTDAHLFYGLNGKCPSCGPNTILFEFSLGSRFYELVTKSEHVDDLLNDEAVNQHFGMVWTKELDLVEKLMLNVSVSGLLNASILVESGTLLGKVETLSDYLESEEYRVASGSIEAPVVYNSTHLVSRNMNVVVQKWVNVQVGAPINNNTRFLGSYTLENVAHLLKFSLDDFIVMDNSGNVLNKSSMIETNTLLKLCHNVTVSGVLNKSFIAEHGTNLGDINEITFYFSPSFVIYHSNDTHSVLTRDTQVLSDIVANITDVSNQEIVIKFDDNENITKEDVENAIKDLVELPSDEHVWIEVISQGDNSFIISVKQTGTEDVGISDLLKKCALSNL